MALVFRKATMEDARLLFQWRNDELTRKNSLSSDEISWEQHQAWFEKSLTSSSRQIYIFESEGESIGSLRVDQLTNVFELSWQLNPLKRGQGFGKQMLRQFVEEYKIRPLQAKIKASNKASIKMTEAAGFVQSGLDQDVQIWHLTK